MRLAGNMKSRNDKLGSITRDQRGFTLLELILVLLLAGVILGLSGFMVLSGALPSARLNATARELSATLREARVLARLTGEKQVVGINLDARTFGIEGRRTRSIPPDTSIVVQDPFIGEVRRGVYQFKPAGMSEGGSILLRSGRKSALIRVDPIVGAVTIATGNER